MALQKPNKNNTSSKYKKAYRKEKTAPKTPQQSNELLLGWRKIVQFIDLEKIRFTVGLLLIVFVIYALLSMISYLFTGAADKSIFDNISFVESLKHRAETRNWTSVMGAYLSEKMIADGFGLGAFLILFLTLEIALRLLGKKRMPLWRLFFFSFFWIFWGAFTLSYIAYVLPLFQPNFFSLGGRYGDYIAISILKSFLGHIGAVLIIITTLLIYLILVNDKTILFLRKLFPENREKTPSLTPSDEPSSETISDTVAVGTEIIPEEWVVQAQPEVASESTFSITPKEKETPAENQKTKDNVGFEITKPTQDDTNLSSQTDSNHRLEQLGQYDPTLDLQSYIPPKIDLLKGYTTDTDLQVNMEEQNSNKDRIITTLKNFGIEITSIKATVGPTITLYEIVPKSGVRISKIRNLESDIMLSLAATGIRIIAPIPGKGTIGIEVPNNDPQIVSMRSVLSSKKFVSSKMELPIAFGKTITNDVFMIDLAKMPHLLVAGATGQGKSVGLNALITSLLYKKHPAELKFVLIDPKKVEFNIYAEIEKHFLAKLPDGEDAIITDTTKVVETLNSLTAEMDERYDLLKKAHVRNLREYNEKFINRHLNPEKGHKFLPYIVVIVDEFGDLIMTAGKEVEMPIARIAQLARAVGIHMVIATQRPSVNIITGIIKANFPARVAFRVSSMMDSRTILDTTGANQLVGRGDMLFSQGSDLVRVQCAFVDTPEVEDIVHFIGNQRGYSTAFYLPEPKVGEGEGLNTNEVDMSKKDPIFEEVARMIVASQQGSTSMIQRKFSIGYNRAGRIMDQIEVAGIVGAAEGSKPRQVLISTEYELEQLLSHL